MKKGFVHFCRVPKESSIKTEDRVRNVSRKDLSYVYNKYYKNQVAALYRAIHSN
jgi:predicted Zn-dependent peptidase